MQPQPAQNIIITSNKKKKYTSHAQAASTVLVTKQQQQVSTLQNVNQLHLQRQQYNINKGFNLVSITMTSNAINTAGVQQQSHHSQQHHGTAHASQYHPPPSQPPVHNYQINKNFISRRGNNSLTSLAPSANGTSVTCTTKAVLTLHHTGHTACTEPLHSQTVFNLSSHRAVPDLSRNTSAITSNAAGLLTAATATYIGNTAEVLVQDNRTPLNVYRGNTSNAARATIASVANPMNDTATNALSLLLYYNSPTNVTNPNTPTSLLTAYASNSSYISNTAIEEKNNVGLNTACVDSRKYDYITHKYNSSTLTLSSSNSLITNNNIKSNYQTHAEYAPPNAANNTTARTNQPTTGNIYRQNPTSPAPRNRFVQAATMYPSMHQSVVLGQFTAPYPTRTPQLQQCQYSHQYYPHMYYPYYVPPPQQQRASVNPGVGLSSAMSVQPGGSVSGPTGATGTPSQIPLGVAPVAPNTVLSVANTTSPQPVGVAPFVGMPHQPPTQQQQPQSTIKAKLRAHALQIIDPVTYRNILEDLNNDKKESSNITPGSTQLPTSLAQSKDTSSESDVCSVSTLSSIQHSTTSTQSVANISETSKPLEITHSIETSSQLADTATCTQSSSTEKNFKEITQQTPVVSAMTDAPSVEIFPTQPQKTRSKKLQNVPFNKAEQSINQGKTEEAIKKTTDVPITRANNTNSICVQESLPTNYIDQQVPQQEQVDKQQEINITSSSCDINNITKTEESVTAKNFGASEQKIQQSDICIISETVKNMQLGEKEILALPQQKQINIVSNEPQHQEEQYEVEQHHINVANGNKLATSPTTTSTESIDNNVITTNDTINNNNSKNHTVTNAKPILVNKNVDKLDRKNDHVTNKSQPTELPGNETEISNNTTKPTELKDGKAEKHSIKSAATTSTISPPPLSSSDSYEDDTKTEPDNDGHASDKKETESVSSPITSTDETSAHNNNNNSKQSFESLITYNEGQWSPSNPTGKKQYDRDQLIQLREAKASRVQPEVKNTSIFSQTNLMPAFASRGNKKVSSMVGGYSGARGSSGGDNYQNNYLKQSSMSGRGGGGGDGGHHNRNSDRPIIRLNLSLNQDVKLNEADNAWRPRVLVKSTDPQVDSELNTKREKDELIRRVRGILNKLTPEKFEPLVEEIIKLKIDTMDKMEAVMILVFEKAIDEPNFSVSYASLCHRLINEVKARDERMESGTKTNLSNFRSALIDKTEREFTYNVTKSSAKEEKLKPIKKKIANCKDPNEKVELEALLEEEERKIRRRSGGTVRFIGELFKISILTVRIINTCIEALLKEPDNEDMLECLCKLLTTVGQKFEQTHISKDEKRQKYSLDSVIERMQAIASKSENSKISSRVRFMLQDVIDLRKKNWQSTRNEAPKTMEQIEKEANNEQLNSSYHYMNLINSGGSNSGGGSSKRDDRGGRNDGRSGNYAGSHSQRGDTNSLKRQQGGGGSHSQSSNSNNDDTWHVQTGKRNSSQALDSNKLGGLANVDMNNKKMGTRELFLWGMSSSTPSSTPSNQFAALSVDSNKSSDRDRDRDRSGPRNKGSYNKGSMERDRYDHDRLLSRTGSSQASRENSSSRSTQGVRSMGGNSSNMQKSASHSKYQQPMSSLSATRMTGKMPANSGAASSNLYRDSQQQHQSYFSSSTSSTTHQHFNPAGSDTSQHSSCPPPAVFEEPNTLDYKALKAVVIEMVENAANSKCIDATTVSCLNKVKENQRCGVLYYILTDYLHLVDVGPCRRHLANVVAYLIEKKYISVEHFRLAYKHFANLASDLIVDIPELWLYIFEFTGPLIVKKIISVTDLWNSQLRNSDSPAFSKKFLKTFIQYCTREVGPSFTRAMWKKNHIKWTDFMDENEVSNFIETNKFEYVENENCHPDIESKESKENRNKRVVEHVEQLLKEGSNADNVIDYINGNIVDVDKTFIKSLTTTLTSFAIKDSSNYSLDLPCFRKICIPVLLRYLDNKEDLELECLYAIQLLVHSLEHPRGLLGAIFGELNDGDVIPQETFIAWRDSKDQSAGKGVAVKALNPFFNQVINGETSDDN